MEALADCGSIDTEMEAVGALSLCSASGRFFVRGNRVLNLKLINGLKYEQIQKG